MRAFPTEKLGHLASDEGGAIAIGPFGSRMKADLYVPTGIPVIRGTNISPGRALKGEWVYVTNEFSQTIPNCITRHGDLVFPHRGAIGEVALIQEGQGPFVLSSSMMKFRPDTRKVDGRFLFYFFKSSTGRSEILRFASQVGTPGIGQPLTSLRQFTVPLPERAEQTAIADVLSALDDKIELNRRMNETLEGMARAIFKDWFVDFGPTRAKMEGRASYLAHDLWSLFPDRLDDEGKPEGWAKQSFRDLAEIRSGGTPSKGDSTLWGGDTPWISPKAMNSIHVFDSEDRVTPSAINSGTRIAPNGSTLLMVRGMGLHQGVRISQARRDVAFNQDVKAFIPKNVDSSFLLFAVLSVTLSLFERVESSGHGTGKLPTEIIDSYEIVTPPTRIGAILVPFIDALNERIAANASECETLASLRDLLLPKLMSGEIRVNDEKLVGGAA